jgi:hypothetical protein
MSKYDMDHEMNKRLNLLLQVDQHEDVKKIIYDYEIIAVNYLSSDKSAIEFNFAIQDNNIISRIESILSKTNLWSKYQTIPKFDVKLPIREQSYCECGQPFYVNADGILKCECGLEEQETEYVNDEVIAETQHSKKKDTYEDFKHSNDWLFYLQGYSKNVIPQEVIIQVKRQLQVLGIKYKKDVNAELIRECLKQINQTEFNNRTSIIVEIITGEPAIKFTSEELDKIKDYVKIALGYFKSDKQKNSPYHPYIIMRIIEEILPEVTEAQLIRKCKIMGSIHKQTLSTLKNKDAVWEKICPMLGFQYTPSNIHKYKTY